MLLIYDDVMGGNKKVLFNKLYFIQMTYVKEDIMMWTSSCHFLRQNVAYSKQGKLHVIILISPP
jgi:hypothetical protein